MKIEISNGTQLLMEKSNIIFKVAEINQLQEIIKLYKDRSDWFKKEGIEQWSKYIIRHEKEFPVSIENKNYYILKKDEEIIAGFELSYNPGNFVDNNKSLYINKIVTKVGYKNLGKLIFEICEDIAKANNKKYLRLECKRQNQKLNEIYDKHGFRLIGYGKTYYDFCLREKKIVKNEDKL